MPYTKIKETCLYIDDLDIAEKFYHQELEMPLISKVDGRHVFFRCGGSVLLCFLPEVTKNEINLPPHYAYGKQHLAFEVKSEDYLEIRDKLSKKEIKVTHTQDWGKGLSSFYFEDPFGNVLEIIPQGIWE
ncbi:VOC family protein [Cyclobacterium qasimii]|uniref:VOC family protein n=1 Tax=Cyclobacterium qasimii TaxID=1350429 RepID=UPI00058E5AAF|nr:VOC family protein [Cyclobacterium qasimii]